MSYQVIFMFCALLLVSLTSGKPTDKAEDGHVLDKTKFNQEAVVEAKSSSPEVKSSEISEASNLPDAKHDHADQTAENSGGSALPPSTKSDHIEAKPNLKASVSPGTKPYNEVQENLGSLPLEPVATGNVRAVEKGFTPEGASMSSKEEEKAHDAKVNQEIPANFDKEIVKQGEHHQSEVQPSHKHSAPQEVQEFNGQKQIELQDRAASNKKPAEAGHSESAGKTQSDEPNHQKGHEDDNKSTETTTQVPEHKPDSEHKKDKHFSVSQLRDYIDYYSEEMRRRSYERSLISWDYATNITDENSARKVNSTLQMATWKRNEWLKNISRFDLTVLEKEGQEELLRLFDQIKILGIAALDDEKMTKRTQLINNMVETYSSATICPFDNQDCDKEADTTWSLDPEITNIFQAKPKQEDYEKLAYVWEKWRDVSGKKYRKNFLEYVKLNNDGAVANKNPEIKDASDLWVEAYESKTFRDDMGKMYEELKPFYQELHAFVRYKLGKVYGKDKVSTKDYIPAHILGNMWAQSWEAIFPAISDFNTTSLDVTDEMKKQNYTVRQMYEMADKFYKDLGLESVEDAAKDFYKLSMLEKPKDRKAVCHASAWDFFATNKLPGDFRIKMCTSVDMADFITIHHELGHIQYYMQYVEQNPLFREGANPGFHEAIGDTLALSVSTTKHLKSVNLLGKDFELDKDSELAFLLRTALDKVAFLPYGYLMDLYRWRLFNGSIDSGDLNGEWWKLRKLYQGIKAPVNRSEDDFDAGAKYHVAASTPYIRYFVAHILQFTFHQYLCEAAGEFNPNDPEEKPLANCDINGSKAAGDKLKKLLKAGSSKHWKETLHEMTGSGEMSVEPLLNYFKPLRKYLQDYIKEKNIHVGWDEISS